MNHKFKISFLGTFLFFLVICSFVYFNALDNDFIFDDHLLILSNFSQRHLSLDKILRADIAYSPIRGVSPFSTYYRPLLMLSFALDYSLWGFNPLPYRLENIVLQALNSFMLYLLIYLVFRNKTLSLISATLFCLHPISVSLVSFISGRASLLETLFIFLSLIAYLGYARQGQEKKTLFILSLLLFMLALLCREGAVLLPLFIFICGLYQNLKKREVLVNLIPYLFILMFYVAWRLNFTLGIKPPLANTLSLKNMATFIWWMQDYFVQLILPVGFQTALLGKSMLLKSLLFWAAFLLLAYLIIRAVVAKDRIAIFSLAFYGIGLLPLLKLRGLIDFLGRILSEHYIYISSIGFFIFIADLILRLESGFKKVARLCLILCVASYSVLTVINNNYYQDDIAFYRQILKVEPQHKFAHINLGNIFCIKKLYSQASEQANLALAIDPNEWKAYLLLGSIAKDQGDWERAIQLYEKTLDLNPSASEAFYSLGLIYQAQGNGILALDNFRKAALVSSSAPWAIKNLANFLFEEKLFYEAIGVYEEILKSNPIDIDSWIKLGIILAEMGYPRLSEASFQEALKIQPTSVEALFNLGVLYANTGDFTRARIIWERVLKIQPAHPQSQEYLKEVSAILGQA